MKITMKSKIILMGIFAALTPILIMLALINYEKNHIKEYIKEETSSLMMADLQNIVKNVHSLLETQNDLLTEFVAANLKVTGDTIKKAGGISVSKENIKWTAVNQLTKETVETEIPKLLIGGTWLDQTGAWLGQNYESEKPSPIVDDVVKLVGGTCTIFQKMNEKGDMLRIATTVIGADKKRAIGTYIPAINPDGKANPIISDILSGKEYRGRAFVVDSWYVTSYAPLKNNSGDILGMYFVGIKQESVPTVRKEIMKIKVGKTGYVYILGGTGAQKGKYIISKDGLRDGENLWEAKDNDGRLFIQNMVDNTISKKDQIHIEHYNWKNTGEKESKNKTAACIYFEPWDWVIGAGTYNDEFMATVDNVTDIVNELSQNSIKIGLIAFIISLISAIVISGGIYRNIMELSAESRAITLSISEGDLSKRGNVDALNFEFKPIISGINDMMEAFIKPMKLSSDYIHKISQGNMPPRITDEYKGEFNDVKNNLNECIDSINRLITDAKILSTAATAGDLSTRADETKHRGDFQKVVHGMNETVIAFVTPINEIIHSLEDLSNGKIDNSITSDYNGEFNKLKDSLNKCILNINFLMMDTETLLRAAHDGELSKRADASTHFGEYKKLVEGINQMIDNILMPVNEARGCLEKMAKGNLDTSITGDYKGDHAILKNAMNQTIDSMNDLLNQVLMAVDQVNTGAKQVSDASQSLSQGATESASSLEEISSSVQQINSSAKQNAENASQADLLAKETCHTAEGGYAQVTEMTAAMNEINEASASVSKIIKSIDEIAFQTNLLALNAAVEAARAGKHGKGFTVVAEEVRNLAQRSAKAAKETAEMIENSIKKANAGTKIAGSTSKALEEIVKRITKVTDIVGEIASSSKEQTHGIMQVNQGLGQVDQVTQQNTATAEESAAASEELSSQAAELKALLEKFTLKGGKTEVVNAYLKSERHDAQKASATKPRQIAQNPHIINKNKKSSTEFHSNKKINPEDIISLDDKEFGKF